MDPDISDPHNEPIEIDGDTAELIDRWLLDAGQANVTTGTAAPRPLQAIIWTD